MLAVPRLLRVDLPAEPGNHLRRHARVLEQQSVYKKRERIFSNQVNKTLASVPCRHTLGEQLIGGGHQTTWRLLCCQQAALVQLCLSGREANELEEVEARRTRTEAKVKRGKGTGFSDSLDLR